MNNKLKLKVYHGTSIDCGIKIIKYKYYIFSKGEREWLGKGAYFFIDDNNIYSKAVENAKKWALNIKNFRDCYIIETIIEVEEDKYMNLDKKEWKEFYHESRKEIIKNIIKNGLNVELDKSSKLECYVIDKICETENIQAVSQEKFVNFEKAYNGKKIASSYVANCKMLCIKDVAVIRKDSIKKVKEERIYG